MVYFIVIILYCNCKRFTEASLKAPDFTIYVKGSSWNYLLFSLLLSPSIYLHPQSRMGWQEVERKEEKIRKRNLYDLLNTEIVKSVTIIYLLHKHIP